MAVRTCEDYIFYFKKKKVLYLLPRPMPFFDKKFIHAQLLDWYFWHNHTNTLLNVNIMVTQSTSKVEAD